MEEIFLSLLTIGVQKYPMLMTVFFVIGFLRAINKPLFSFLNTLVKATPTVRDDEILAVVEQSKIYKAIAFVLDWTASIKLPKKVEAVPVAEVSSVITPSVPVVSVASEKQPSEPNKAS